MNGGFDQGQAMQPSGNERHQPQHHDGLVAVNHNNCNDNNHLSVHQSLHSEATSANQADASSNTNSNEEGSSFPPPFVIRVTAIAGLGGILFGYDLGVVSTALPHLTQDFDLSKTEEEWVVSILYVGGFLGAIFGGSLCDTMGRKTSILITDVFFLIGALLLFLAPTYGMVLLGRIVVGFAVAVSGIADVAYLHEIAPLNWRGSIVSVNEACISLGFLLAFATGSVLTELAGEENNDAWRLMFGLSGVIALVQLFGMLDMPESPKWLRECGRHEESAAALRRINSLPEIMEPPPNESTPIEQSTTRMQAMTYNSVPNHHTASNNNTNGTTQTSIGMEEEEEVRNGTTGASVAPDHISSTQQQEQQYEPHALGPIQHGGWLGRIYHYIRQAIFLVRQAGSFLTTTMTHYPRQGWITVFLSVTQQLCGQTNVLSYAPQIFASVSDDDNASSYVKGWTTVSIGVVKFLITVLVIWKIEAVGRRPLLLSGMGAIALGLLLLILASSVPGSSVKGSRLDTDDDGTAASSDESNGSGFGLAISGVMLVVCGYSMSFGPLTWLLTSEIFPTEIRGRALGASTILNFGSAIFVTSTFLSFQSALGNTAVFGSYMLVTVAGCFFALMAIPETKEKNVQQIDATLDRMLWWRGYTRGRALREIPQHEEGDSRRQKAGNHHELT